MKKWVAFLLSLSMLLALVSCGKETKSVTSEPSDVSSETSSEEELPADRLAEKEVQSFLAEYAKYSTGAAEKATLDIHIDMGGMKIDTTQETENYFDNGTETSYLRVLTTDENGEQAQITYFKDGRLYTITESTMGGMKMTEGYYEEKTWEDVQNADEVELTEEMLRKATVVRDENGCAVTIEDDALNDMANGLIAGQLGDLVDQGAAVNIESFLLTFRIGPDGILKGYDEDMTCKITVEQDDTVIEISFSMKITGEILAYGEGSDFEIPEPKHLKTYPSFAEYMENQYGEGWEEWYYDDETGEV